MNRRLIFTAVVLILSTAAGSANASGTLSTAGIKHGQIAYYEMLDDSAQVARRAAELESSNLKLHDVTTGVALNVGAKVNADFSSYIVSVTFTDSSLSSMQGDVFGLYVNGQLVSTSEVSAGSAPVPVLQVDAKPSLDVNQPQEVDVYWARSFTSTKLGSFYGNAQAEARANFTSKPDSGSPNRVQWDLAYRVIYADAGPFKYFGLSGRAGGEHPQDFSRTNIVGAAVLSTIVPWTDILAREVKGNWTDPSLGLLVEPAVEYVYNTNPGDTSYIRGAIYGGWEIPIASKEYAELYSTVYFQKGYRPRGYIDLTFAHKLSSTFALVIKWIDGEMPPLFLRVADLRVGLRMQ